MSEDVTLEEDSQEVPAVHGKNKEYSKEFLAHRFKPGQSGNPDGRPKGSISPMQWIRNYFARNPDDFETWLMDYISNPKNERHLLEMWEGRPAQRLDIGAEVTQKLIKLDE
jgi:hypothetical protein